MARLKVCVYAICKDEEKHIEQWVDSMGEADGIYVLDTGSSDRSVELLINNGITVKSEAIVPWRFDIARNTSLEMVPEDTDICVCTDLDELFRPGWRKAMEDAWSTDTHRLRYRYTWSFNGDGTEGSVFWISKAHARKGFIWTHPVHEVLEWQRSDPCIEKSASGVSLEHYPDSQKSRAQYLPLLELSVQENPIDDRNMHYLGREYMYYGRWKECEETLRKHLLLPSANWPDERSASMRFIARAIENQQRSPNEVFIWLLKSATEAPHLREPWIELSEFESRQNNWSGSLYFAEKALQITERSESYINEADSWSYKPYDLAALAAYYLHQYDTAEKYGEMALAYNAQDTRLTTNLKYYRDKASQ